jgi:two-component system response regulator LytT
MNVLILEDESAAARRIQKLLAEAAPDAKVVAVLESIADAGQWLGAHTAPDIILSDIHLADGLALQLFQEQRVNVPVIFTTAYDAYTLKAFKLNSVDYLLKPIDVAELKTALDKYRQLHSPGDKQALQLAELMRQMTTGKEPYKSRFLVKMGERLIIVPVADVAYIRADDKVVFLHTNDGKKYLIDDPLDELTRSLDPVTFFRVNRTYIAPLSSIEKIHNHFNGRLKLELRHSDDKEIFVSRARVADFKKWLNR